MQCSMGCGGEDCKYDNPAYWREDQQAIKGLYSSWYPSFLLFNFSNHFTSLTCHKLEFNIITLLLWLQDHGASSCHVQTVNGNYWKVWHHWSVQTVCTPLFLGQQLSKGFWEKNDENFFAVERSGIKSIINLQMAGEHASCGKPLEPDSGFSYRPEVFMENNSMYLGLLDYWTVGPNGKLNHVMLSVFFYNYGWSDYGVANLTRMLDMVKVMAFALQEGKVAVHCHAGLGRTGRFLRKCVKRV